MTVTALLITLAFLVFASCDRGSPPATTEPYRHTITIDGANDFVTADEQFDTSTSNYFGYIAWDASYLYLGMEGPSIGANDADYFLLVYLGGSSGGTIGMAYGTQTPRLPFSARWHIHWCTTGSDNAAYEYDGSWASAGWDFTDDISKSGNYVEMRIPLSDIGNPASIQLHLSIIEQNSWTYAGVPSSSFVDADDPDYSRYYQFDMDSENAPNEYTSL